VLGDWRTCANAFGEDIFRQKMTTDFEISPVSPDDSDGLWSILEPVFRTGDTYTIEPSISQEAAIAYWCGTDKKTFVVRNGSEILGTYYIRPNQAGGGSHVCNCGYMTAPFARGRGVARAMLEHSLQLAPKLGYRAMQYNFVVSTNRRAVDIWQQYGFEIVGRLPRAFAHPVDGFVDAYVMYKELTD
jgi:ribosomal protein S18 acetylase RimI-like enzyme